MVCDEVFFIVFIELGLVVSVGDFLVFFNGGDVVIFFDENGSILFEVIYMDVWY